MLGWRMRRAEPNIHLLFAKGKFYFQQFFTLLWTFQKQQQKKGNERKRRKAQRLVYSLSSRDQCEWGTWRGECACLVLWLLLLRCCAMKMMMTTMEGKRKRWWYGRERKVNVSSLSRLSNGESSWRSKWENDNNNKQLSVEMSVGGRDESSVWCGNFKMSKWTLGSIKKKQQRWKLADSQLSHQPRRRHRFVFSQVGVERGSGEEKQESERKENNFNEGNGRRTKRMNWARQKWVSIIMFFSFLLIFPSLRPTPVLVVVFSLIRAQEETRQPWKCRPKRT